MNRFLKNKLNLIFVIFVLFLGGLTIKAASKTEYYLEEFRNWAQVKGGGKVFTDLSLAKDTKYLLVLSSQLNLQDNQDEINENFTGEEIIVICDERIELSKNNYCDYSSVNTQNLLTLQEEEELLGGQNVQIGKQLFLDKPTHFIPEQYLTTPDLKDHVSDYLKQYFKKSPLIVQEGEQKEQAETVKSIKDIIKTPVFESFTYAAVILILVAVLRGLLINLNNNPKQFAKLSFYKQAIYNLIDFFEEYYWLFNFTLIIGTLGFIPILILISVLDKGSIDISYMVTYLFDTLNAQSLIGFISQQSETRVQLFTYIVFFLALVVLRMLPQILKLFLRSFSLMFDKKRSVNPNAKWVPVVLIGLSFVISSYFSIEQSYIWITYFVLISLYFVYLLESSDLKTHKLFSVKEKVLVLLIILLLFGVGFGVKRWQQNRPVKYDYESLIGVDNDIVLFPYKKDFDGPTLFDEFIYEGNVPVLVQNYLVYYPGFNQIKNRDISKFNSNNSFIVQSSSKEGVYEEILSNSSLRDYLFTENPTQSIYLQDFSFDLESDYTMEFMFECDKPLPKSELKLNVYTLNEFEDEKEVQTENETIFVFPGCGEEQPEEIEVVEVSNQEEQIQEEEEEQFVQPIEVSYSVPFDQFLISNTPALLELEFDNSNVSSSLSEIQIYRDGNPIEFSYISYEPNENLLMGDVRTGDNEIYSYSFGLEEEIDFEVTDFENFDLSKPINKLQKKDLLPNPFIIWSTEEHAVLKN